MVAERTTRVKDQFGKMVEGTFVEVRESVERFSNVTLEDGTILRAKLVVIKVARLENQWDQDGNPMYVVNSQNIITVVDSPSALKRNPPESSKNIIQ